MEKIARDDKVFNVIYGEFIPLIDPIKDEIVGYYREVGVEQNFYSEENLSDTSEIQFFNVDQDIVLDPEQRALYETILNWMLFASMENDDDKSI